MTTFAPTGLTWNHLTCCGSDASWEDHVLRLATSVCIAIRIACQLSNHYAQRMQPDGKIGESDTLSFTRLFGIDSSSKCLQELVMMATDCTIATVKHGAIVLMRLAKIDERGYIWLTPLGNFDTLRRHQRSWPWLLGTRDTYKMLCVSDL